MAKVSDQELAVARVYSAAILQLAGSSGDVDALLKELGDFAGRVEKSADLQVFLSSPTVDVEARRGALEKMFRGRRSDLFVDSLQVLNRKGRLGLISSIAEAYRHAREELHGRVEANVRTAAPLTDKLRAKLREVVEKRTGMKADLHETVDESLIGGLIVQIGDRKYDACVATKLRTLTGALLERASHEIHGGRDFVAR